MAKSLCLLQLLSAAWLLLLVDGFLPAVYTRTSSTILNARQQQHSEYEEAVDEDKEHQPLVVEPPPQVSTTQQQASRRSSSSSTNTRMVALRRGCVVKIIVGSNHRKAWKKRRRSGSPLLVACSIQSMDALSAIRCNVLHILRGNSRANVKLVASQYRQMFGTPLAHEGFDRLELLQHVFKNPKYKISVMEKNGKWYLESYRHRPEVCPMLEFNEEYLHTGALANGESVSAALRISSTEPTPEPGTELFAIVWDFEPEGDAGFPLVTVSLTPPNERGSSSTKKQLAAALPTGYRLRGVVTKGVKGGVFVQCVPSKLHKEPIRGVLRYRDARLPVEPRDSDMYEMKDDDDKEYTFKKERTIDDLFENDNGDEEEEEEEDESDDEEDLSTLLSDSDNDEEEDITDLFLQNEDGSLSFTNPETGLVETIEMLDDDEEDESTDEEDDKDEGSDVTEAVSAPEDTEEESNKPPTMMSRYRSVRVNVGDQVDVFVKTHIPQKRELYLTMDPTIKDLPKKERRQLDTVSKRTERLAKRLGGFKAIRRLRGTECEGIVKATSNMGDRRLYIQPNEDLPVGVATCPDELLEELQQGDSVRVRLDGLDEQRGQLAMFVLERIDRSLRLSTTEDNPAASLKP